MLSIIAMLPHGVQVIPEIGSREHKGFKRLHQAMTYVSKIFNSIHPTTIILITPHGIATDNHLGIYLNDRLSGKIAFDQHELPELFTYENHVNMATQLHRDALEHGHEVTRIVAGVSSGSGFLQWGELVPLHYTAKQLTPTPKIVVISTPLKRYENLEELTPQLIAFGQFLGEFIEKQDEKIALVVSGDLSHVHDPKGPYGFHDTCKKFDEVVLHWLRGDDDSLLAEKALPFDKTAKSCGLAPLFILQGVVKTKNPTRREVLAYETPTYFGMVVSTFSFH